MIKIKNITKSFYDRPVLGSISGEFDKGKTNLIIGSFQQPTGVGTSPPTMKRQGI